MIFSGLFGIMQQRARFSNLAPATVPAMAFGGPET
jgi:hypothetical protein